MKKLLLSFMAAVGLLITGSGTAWADTESLTTISDKVFVKSQTLGGTSFSISGTYVADFASKTSCRIRVNQSAGDLSNTIKIDVKEGYTISALEFTAQCAQSGSATITAVYVDDDLTTNKLSTEVSISKNATSKVSVSNLGATKAIYLVTKRDDAVIQLIVDAAKFTYTDTFTKPETTTDITTTWSLANGNITDEPEFSVDNGAFSMAGITVGDSLSVPGKLTFVNVAGTKFHTIKKKTEIWNAAKVNFNLTPKKGITFVPTKVSFKAVKCGTDGGYVSYVINCGGRGTFLESEKDINRNNSTSWTDVSSPVSGVRASADFPCNLEIFIYNNGDNKQVALSNVVIEGYYYGEAEEETTYSVKTSVTPSAGGSVNQNPGNTTILAGNKVVFTAKPSTGYKFVKWTDAAGTLVSESATYTIASLEANVELIAVFEALPTVIYAKDNDVEGSIPSQVWDEAGNKVTLPINTSLYKEGYTLTGWSDGTTTYAPGSSLTLKEDDKITLTAVFTENATPSFAEWIATAELTSNKVLNWSFQRSAGAPTLTYEGTTGVYTIQTTYGENTIDVPMKIETTDNAVVSEKKGKLNNSSDASKAQVNTGTRFTIPVSQGAVITLGLSSGTFKAKVNDEADVVTNEKLSYTYTGTETKDINIDITEVSGVLYLTGVSITYPLNLYNVTVSSINAATLCMPLAVKIPEEGVKAYTGELSDNTLTLTQVEGVIPAGEAVILVGEAGSYKFEVSSEAGTKATKNDLVGNSTSSEITPPETNATVCVLDKVNNELGFYKWTGKIPAYKAYLAVPNATTEETSSSAPEIRVVFNDEPGNVTAIESIAAEAGENAPIYTLSGRQVKGIAAPGLYIQGGKKILVK
jgi:hypothetical protein